VGHVLMTSRPEGSTRRVPVETRGGRNMNTTTA
jgi:hypothetical protein